MYMSLFKDKILLITGGTGSFSDTILNRFPDVILKKLESFLEVN